MSITSGDAGFAREAGSWNPGIPYPSGALHIASLDYLCTVGELTAANGKSSFSIPDPARFSFAFETAPVVVAPGVFQVGADLSWFDQTTSEANIAFAMSQIVAAVAEMLGLDVGQVNKAVLIRRVWTYAPNIQGTQAGSGRTVTIDVMPYPPRASVDVAHGVDRARISATVSAADSGRGTGAAYGFGGDWVHAAESASHTP